MGHFSRTLYQMVHRLKTNLITRTALEEEVIKRSAELNAANLSLREEIEEGKRREESIKYAEENIRSQMQFEELISRLSTEFINLPSDQIDGKIELGLKLVVEALNIDRIVFHEFSEDKQLLSITHFFAKPGIERPESTITTEAQPWFTKTILTGEMIRLERIDSLPEEAILEKAFLGEQGVQSVIVFPLEVGEKVVGVVSYATVFHEQSWSETLSRQLQLVSEVFANALDRKQREQNLQVSISEIKRLNDKIQEENLLLREEIELEKKHDEIVGKSPTIMSTLKQAEQVSKTESTVLILGETGTGKELLAREIHRMSTRKDRTMVKVNCAALPSSLMESELFGREKGAYTGALSKQMGRFEIADGSTIFLDEIGELQIDLQTKLLRVLQDGQFERLGSSRTISVNARVIAATNRELAKLVKEGRFREDLYYRLNVFPITMPPLRDRSQDIPLLVWAFIREFGESMGKHIETIPKQSMDALQDYAWPGNVRELRNIIERAMIRCAGSTLKITVRDNQEPTVISDATLAGVEREHIVTILHSTGWRVRGSEGAAEILGLKPSTLESRMKKLGIKRQK